MDVRRLSQRRGLRLDGMGSAATGASHGACGLERAAHGTRPAGQRGVPTALARAASRGIPRRPLRWAANAHRPTSRGSRLCVHGDVNGVTVEFDPTGPPFDAELTATASHHSSSPHGGISMNDSASIQVDGVPRFYVVFITTRFRSFADVRQDAPEELASHIQTSKRLHEQAGCLWPARSSTARPAAAHHGRAHQLRRRSAIRRERPVRPSRTRRGLAHPRMGQHLPMRLDQPDFCIGLRAPITSDCSFLAEQKRALRPSAARSRGRGDSLPCQHAHLGHAAHAPGLRGKRVSAAVVCLSAGTGALTALRSARRREGADRGAVPVE